MHLHIVRHGQTDWNAERRIQGQSDSQLDNDGIAQCIDRRESFAHLHFEAVYSSTSLRTRQTTHYLLDGQTDDVIYMDELREITLGIWEGRLWQDIENEFPDLVKAHLGASESFDVEGAERHSQVQARGIFAIESIINNHTEAGSPDILVVSHGAIMKTILAYYLEVALGDIHALPSLPNCAHCILEVSGESRRIVRIAGDLTEETPWSDYAGNNASKT